MTASNRLSPLKLETSPNWEDYALLDSGDGKTLERFGPYLLIRPRPQAIWSPGLPASEWKSAHALLIEEQQEFGGKWKLLREMERAWPMRYRDLRFQAQLSSSRHVGVFPEQASHWDFLQERIRRTRKPFKMLNLFGYSGLATLAGAAAGAEVTHVDASKHALNWASYNLKLSGLSDCPVRWIAEDALKFVQREARRGNVYHGLVMDPPKFGRGSNGEVWDFFKRMPDLIEGARQILAPDADFVILTAYAITASAVITRQAVEQMVPKGGQFDCGELVSVDTSSGQVLSHALYTRWKARD